MVDKPRMLKQAAVARELKVSRQYISKLVQAGRIELHDGLIDIEAARIALVAHADITRTTPDTVAARVGHNVLALPNADLTAPLEKYNAAKAEREHWASLREQLAYETEVGALIDAQQAVMAVQNLAAAAVAALLRIPDRLSAELAAETEPTRIHEMMTAAIEHACAELAEGAADIFKQDDPDGHTQ